MGCPRCGGLMRREQFHDHFEFTRRAEFVGWQCINCGEIVDRVIVANRCQTRKAGPVRILSPGVYLMDR